MFDLLRAAEAASGPAAVNAWARMENAACARRLAAMAALLDTRLSADGSADREQWCLDNWSAVTAEIGAAQGVSAGVASQQLLVAQALRQRLPRVAQLFAAGAISYPVVAAIVARTALVTDPDARAKIDTELAAHVTGWRGLSVTKLQNAIDYWVDRYDPYALRRTEARARSRGVTVDPATSGNGLRSMWGDLYAHDAEALDHRLDTMARAVCPDDPRTLEQRRADALGALAAGAERLACTCGHPDCPAAQATTEHTVVIHVIAEHPTLHDDSDAHLDGNPPAPAQPVHELTLTEALRPAPPTGPSPHNPALIIGGTTLPAPIAATLATRAQLRTIIHPGASPPEPRHTPSRALADFVRCRDLTCRFPHCDVPAYACDVDHTVPYPAGPTQASNLKALCRKHHLLKTFWTGPNGWTDRQLPDGTIIWTAPAGQTYTTHPGSQLLFPTLTRPTAPTDTHAAGVNTTSGLTMPRRRQTRAHDRTQRIDTERALNERDVREPDRPPPF